MQLALDVIQRKFILLFSVFVLSKLFLVFISFTFLTDILLAGCFIDVQNICKATISKHRTFVALKKSAMYESNTYTSVTTKVRENLYFHLLVKLYVVYVNLLRIRQSFPIIYTRKVSTNV